MIRKYLKRGAVVIASAALLASLALTGCSPSDKSAEAVSQISSSSAEETSEYADMEGTYYTEIKMSEDSEVTIYLQIDDEGNFVFAKDTKFKSDEKGAGTLGKDKDKKDVFVYSKIDGKEVKEGEKCAAYEFNKKDKEITFTSPMWFGSTEPKITKDDGSTSYPVFKVLDKDTEKKLEEKAEKKAEEKKSAEKKNAEKKKNDTKAAGQAQTSEADNTDEYTEEEYTDDGNTEVYYEDNNVSSGDQQYAAAASALTEGTYTGSMEKYVDAMNANVHYDVTLTLSGGSYTYNVGIILSGDMDYNSSESYSGTYSVDGDYIAFYGDLYEGRIYGNSINVTGYLSSFAGDMESVTVFM